MTLRQLFSNFITLLIFSCFSCQGAELSASNFSAAKLENHSKNLNDFSKHFAQFYQQKLNEKAIPGGAFAIVDNNHIVKMQGFGVRAEKDTQPVNEDTIFRLASVSKTFTGVLASLLVKETALSWQDPIVKYRPDFTLANQEQAEQIKLHHLLSHSTGLVPNSYDNLLNASQPLDKIIDQFKRLKPLCKPGVCYGYQNVAFSLIQSAMEHETGKNYEQLLQDKIFTPLDMTTASASLNAFKSSDNKAMPHIKVANNDWRQVRVKANYYQVTPAAGINASVKDLAKWLIANMGNNPDVLPQSVLDEVITKRTFTRRDLYRKQWRNYLENAHYGLGWRIYDFQGNTLIYHAGWVAGYRAEIAYSPELKIGLAMLINAESSITNQISTRFWASIFSQQNELNCLDCEIEFAE
jgi:beta-lactamase class C